MFLQFQLYAHIKILRSGPFYARIKLKLQKHKKITENLSHYMRTRTTKSHFTFFHSEHRDQGTVANKKKLRTMICTFAYLRIGLKKSQPYGSLPDASLCGCLRLGVEAYQAAVATATTAAAAVAATPASASDLVPPALVIERPKRQPKRLSRVEKDEMLSAKWKSEKTYIGLSYEERLIREKDDLMRSILCDSIAASSADLTGALMATSSTTTTVAAAHRPSKMRRIVGPGEEHLSGLPV